MCLRCIVVWTHVSRETRGVRKAPVAFSRFVGFVLSPLWQFHVSRLASISTNSTPPRLLGSASALPPNPGFAGLPSGLLQRKVLTMGRRHGYGLLLVLLLHDEVVYSLAPRASLSHAFQRGACSPRQRGRACTTPQQPRRRTCSTQRSSSRNRMIMSESGMPPPVKAVLSSLLAASVVLTGVVPGLEVESLRPTGRNTVTQVVATAGVPNAAAATFNTEQAAIAETWVRH